MLKQVREQRQTVGVLFPTLIASDTVENGSTKLKIKASGHLAQTGDIIRVTKASNLGVEYYALSTETDYINLNAQLPCDVQPGDSFSIYRLSTIENGLPTVLTDICLALKSIFNALTRPIWYSALTNNLRVQTDTNSTMLTYQLYVYPPSTTQGSTTVWSEQGTNGYSLHRTCWATNVRSRIL
jgi:hypothetical protein